MDISWMILPIGACIVIVLTLGWFGLHVLERGVIFVDLALAQVAALGTTYAVYLGHDAESSLAFTMSLAFTFVGAAAFSAARLFEKRVPQEAIIGIAYAVSAALGILMVHFADDPHGGEKIEHLLVGNLVWVQASDLLLLAAICAAVGLVHFTLRERFLQISYNPTQAEAEGRNVAGWDLLFYLSFGLALTAIVSVSGVLLVFSYLVIPAVIARLLVGSVRARLLLGWLVGLVVSVAGVAVSYSHPTGPIIVGFFGLALLLVLVWYAVWHARSRTKAAIQVTGIAGVLGLLLGGIGLIPADSHHHDAHDHPGAQEQTSAPTPASGLLAADPTIRDSAARAADGRVDEREALAAALAGETDASVALTMAVVLVRLGDRRGLDGLARLTQDEAPFLRMEADSRLRTLAGSAAPTWNPMDAPDSDGNWLGWVSGLTDMPAGHREIPLP
jgi:zinc/manganese transport system permease protein